MALQLQFLFLFLSACCVFSSCPPGWLVGYNTSCYMFHQQSLSWLQASHYCLSLGGHLARIETEAEKKLIREELTHSQGQYWLDGKGDVVESDLRWASTYGKIQEQFWYPGEPNHFTAKEDCLETSHGARGLWNDDESSDHQ